MSDASASDRSDDRRATVPDAPAPRRAGRVLLICRAYATPHHTGSFRWRSLTRLLGERGWEFDVIALEPPDGIVPEAGTGSTSVHLVSPSWWLWRWRQRRLAAYLERERRLVDGGGEPGGAGGDADEPAVEGVGAAGGDAPQAGTIDLCAVPVVSAGQRLGFVEQLKLAATSAIDAADAVVWTRRARNLALSLSARHAYELVLATSPAPETHDVGADVARRTGTPFVAEFRDPRHFGLGPDIVRVDVLTRALSRRAEIRSLSAATAIVDIASGASRASVDELSRAVPALARKRRAIIPSGYEPAPVGPVDAGRFRIVYTGWLWPFMPLPAFLAATGRFVRELDAGAEGRAEDVRVELVGVERLFNGVPVVDIARAAGLDGRFSVAERLPRDVAAHRQHRAAVLVAFDSVRTGGACIPSKLYHYALCHGALLPIGEPQGSMADEARKIGVETFAPGDADGIVAFLHAARERWMRGLMTRPSDAAGTLDFVHRADEMEALFESVRRSADAGADPSIRAPMTGRPTARDRAS